MPIYVLNLFTLNTKILFNASRHPFKETCKNIKGISLILYLLLVLCRQLCVMTIGESAVKLFLSDLKGECYFNIRLKQKLSSTFSFHFFLWEDILFLSTFRTLLVLNSTDILCTSLNYFNGQKRITF